MSVKRLRVLALLHDDRVPPEDAGPVGEDAGAPWRTERDVLVTLQELGHDVRSLVVTDELTPIRQAIEEHRPDVVFNLLQAFHGVSLYDAHVVSYLELLKTAYTGCNPRGLLLANDKGLAKKILSWHRIRTPAFAIFQPGRAVRMPRRLEFPLIVKSTVEHASQGISQASIVQDEAALKERVEFVHRKLGTEALAERYIEGRELTIGVLGNQRLQTFPVWEMTFEKLPPGTAPIATTRVKFNANYQKKIGVITDVAVDLPEGKPEEIARMAKRIYRALSLSGFARVDLRMDAEGQVYVLEANPNPDFCQVEDLARSATLVGLEYPALVQRMLNLGMSYVPAWKDV